MQALGRVSSLGTAYTAAQVTTQLLKATGQERWKFDRLDSGFNYISDLSAFINQERVPEIAHDSTAAVKRRLKLTLRADCGLNVFSDLIRPHYQLLMPDGGFIDFTLGTFLPLPPAKTISRGVTWWALDSTDLGQLLVDGAFINSFAIPAGTSYLGAVQSIATSYGGLTPIAVNIPDPGKTLPAAMGWEYGKTRLSAINDLLAAVNYLDAAFDENGILTSQPIPDYTTLTGAFTFDATASPNTVGGPIQEQTDISQAANQVLVIVEDPRRNAAAFLYQNNRADSPVSLVNWHPKLKVIRDSRMADLSSVAARAQTAAQESARIYSKITVSTLPWPASQDRDAYRLVYTSADDGAVDATYLELGWTHRCKAGVPTDHHLTRIVAA